MADILSVGSRSLLAVQQALNTTGHNISNANTEGYSRQSVNFAAVEAQQFGFGYLGQGVTVDSVERAYDSFLTNQVRNFSSSQSQYATFTSLGARVDDILANSDNSLSTAVQRFFTAAQDVANSPSTLPERQALLGQASNLINRQQSMVSLFKDLNQEVNNHMRSSVDSINSLTRQLASLNQDIASASQSANGEPPNDLLDARDRLLGKLAELVSVNTLEDGDGSISVFVGNGQALVVGSDATQLQVQNNAYDGSKLEIGIVGQTGGAPLSQFLTGGELQGLFDFRKRILDPVQSQMGLLMLGMSDTVNAQQRVGMDLENNLGSDFFQVSAVNVRAHINNGGSAAPVVTVTDSSQVRPSDYQLDFDGAQWRLTRLSDNTSVSGAGPLVMDGMSVDVSAGVPATLDSFRFNPGRDATDSLTLAINDPRKIAAAAPVAVSTTSANTGTGALGAFTVQEPNTLPLAGPITLTFDPDAVGPGVPGFVVSGGPGGTIAYDPATEAAGKTFTFAAEGVSFTVSNNPDAGDSFVIGNNTGAYGDNSNMLKMVDLQHKPLLNGGQDSYQEFYGAMVADVGVTNQQANANLDVETSLLEQANRYKNSATGVNLDEEAANMMRYQQQYQATAQLIKVADEMFRTLLMSIG